MVSTSIILYFWMKLRPVILSARCLGSGDPAFETACRGSDWNKRSQRRSLIHSYRKRHGSNSSGIQTLRCSVTRNMSTCGQKDGTSNHLEGSLMPFLKLKKVVEPMSGIAVETTTPFHLFHRFHAIRVRRASSHPRTN